MTENQEIILPQSLEFKKIQCSKERNINKYHLNSGIWLLAFIISKIEKNNDIDLCMTSLYKNYSNIEYSLKFNRALSEVVKELDWSVSAIYKAKKGLCEFLSFININEDFIKRIKAPSQKTKVSEIDKCIPKRYRDDKIARPMIEEWIQMIKIKSNNKSMATMRQIIYFYTNELCEIINYDFQTENYTETGIDNLYNIVGSPKHINWIKLFLQNVLGRQDTTIIISKLQEQNRIKGLTETDETRNGNVEGDVHRIDSVSLDKIYNVVKGNTLEELIFLLFITTGIRLSALCNIKLIDVYDNNTKTIKNTGKSIEKGNKFVSFVLVERVKVLMLEYIHKIRPATGDYLFKAAIVPKLLPNY